MKFHRMFAALTILVLASLACNAVKGNRPNNSNNNPVVATQSSGDASATTVPNANNGNGSTVKTDFPLTADATNVTDVGDGSILFYTKLSADDVMKFYRDTYSAKGYKERQILTVVSGTTFSMVFDGDPSGKSVVIQSVDLGNGSRTVSIRLEAISQ